MQFIRSFLFLTGEVIITITIGLLTFLMFPFPYHVRYGIASLWAILVLWWLRVTCNITWEVRGTDNIPQQNGIIMCKHQSAWETAALQRVFPPQVWVLKRELLWLPFFGWGMALLEPIAINRKAGRQAMKQITAKGIVRLKRGRWVVVFPEGTRVAPGQHKRYRAGGAMLAKESGFPIVPVAHNAGEYWPRNGFYKRPGCIKMVVGPVIYPENKDADTIMKEVESWIETTMQDISSTN